MSNHESISTLPPDGKARSMLMKSGWFHLACCVLLMVSYLPVFSFYARQHWSATNLQGAYAHAPLTLLFIVFLIWRQRSRLMQPSVTQPDLSGFLLLGFGVCLKIYGDFQGYVVLQGMSLVPVLLGLLKTYHRADTFKALRFPILLLIFIVPLPSAAIDALTFPLINVTAEIVVSILPFFDIDVVKTGQALTVNALGVYEYHEVILAAECSGIRSFVSLLALSGVFANLQERGRRHTAALMLSTIPLVILGNALRVTSTILMIVYVSPDTAESFFHWSSGLLVFAITLVGLFMVDAILLRGRSKTGPEHE